MFTQIFQRIVNAVERGVLPHPRPLSPKGARGAGTVALLLLILMTAAPVFAQDGSGGQGSGNTVKIVQVDTSKFPAITVWVSVTDAQGNPVNIAPGDIQLTENGQPVQVTDVHAVGQGGNQAPISVVLTIDRSGSMLQSGKLEAAKAAASKFVDLMRPEDMTGVIAFNTKVDILQTPTSDKGLLHKAIDGIQAFNDTAMYDGLSASTDMLKGIQGRRAIIILSDGLDNSSKATADSVLGGMQSAETSVYAIGLGDPSQGNSKAGIDEAALKNIAEKSRGSYAYAPNPADLEALYSGLSNQLQNEYQLTYTSGLTLRDGVNRALEVSIAQGGSVGTKYNPGGVIPETSGSLSWLVFGGLLVVLVALLAVPDVLRGGGGLAKSLAPKKKSRVKLGGTGSQSASSAPKVPGKKVAPDSVPTKPPSRPSVRVSGKRG